MKQIFLVAVIVASMATLGWAQEDTEEEPQGFEFIVGPRVGVSYALMTPEEYTEYVHKLFPEGSYYPITTVFGVTLEQRILLGRTRSHFAFQELILVNGLEQSIALPMGALFVGYRDKSGFEVGVGPLLSLAGIGVAGAVGWTLSFRGVYVPIDFNFILPSAQRSAAFGLTTGFNFKIRRR